MNGNEEDRDYRDVYEYGDFEAMKNAPKSTYPEALAADAKSAIFAAISLAS